MSRSETTNVDHKEKKEKLGCAANMLVTYPGEKGIEVLGNEAFREIRDYLNEVGDLKISLTKNTEKELKKYMQKYGAKENKLKLPDEYKVKGKNVIKRKDADKDEGITI